MDLDNLLKEKSIHFFRKGYVTFDGFTMTENYARLKSELDNIEVNENDVWVCTFPKTGTTWTQEMIWMINNNLDFKKGQQCLDERSPYVDFCAVYDTRDMFKIHPDFDPPPYIRDSIGYYKSLKSPLVVKTHLPWQLLPEQIKNGAKRPRIIYVTRDPKDVCVSFYHHCRLLEGFRGTFEEFCELFLGGKVLFGPYWKHILSYWELKNSRNIIFLKYEDMKKDLGKVIRKVAEFLGKTLSEKQVEILIKHLSFDSMKNNPAVNKEILGEINKKFNLTDYHDGKFMRSGKVGDHKNAMTEEMAGRFDNWLKENLENTGFVF